MDRIPAFISTDDTLNTAFRLAMGDLVTCIAPRRGGLLNDLAPVLDAGLDYPTPWVRDSAINIWNGTSLLFPDVMHNNLLSLIDDSYRVSPEGQFDQYWDVVIWSLGAWWHYLYTGNIDLLRLAYRVTVNTLAHCEASEFDAEKNLFRGPAVYGDGISGYPDTYLNNGRSSGILEWRHHNPDHLVDAGYGIPMFTLSTNCLYYEVYRLHAQMAGILVEDAGQSEAKAEALKAAINRQFWNDETGTYRYILDPFGGSDHQEGMGHSFALLFGVADDGQARQITANQQITAAGIPCVYPTFERYAALDGYGRHSGTVWSHIQGLWGHAMINRGQQEKFWHELHQLATRAGRDEQFAELFHPDTGAVYGGLQEGRSDPTDFMWKSCTRQTWSASAYLRLILTGLIGMTVTPEGVQFVNTGIKQGLPLTLDGLCYRDMMLNIRVEAAQADQVLINGEAQSTLPTTLQGTQTIIIYRG